MTRFINPLLSFPQQQQSAPQPQRRELFGQQNNSALLFALIQMMNQQRDRDARLDLNQKRFDLEKSSQEFEQRDDNPDRALLAERNRQLNEQALAQISATSEAAEQRAAIANRAQDTAQKSLDQEIKSGNSAERARVLTSVSKGVQDFQVRGVQKANHDTEVEIQRQDRQRKKGAMATVNAFKPALKLLEKSIASKDADNQERAISSFERTFKGIAASATQHDSTFVFGRIEAAQSEMKKFVALSAGSPNPQAIANRISALQRGADQLFQAFSPERYFEAQGLYRQGRQQTIDESINKISDAVIKGFGEDEAKGGTGENLRALLNQRRGELFADPTLFKSQAKFSPPTFEGNTALTDEKLPDTLGIGGGILPGTRNTLNDFSSFIGGRKGTGEPKFPLAEGLLLSPQILKIGLHSLFGSNKGATQPSEQQPQPQFDFDKFFESQALRPELLPTRQNIMEGLRSDNTVIPPIGNSGLSLPENTAPQRRSNVQLRPTDLSTFDPNAIDIQRQKAIERGEVSPPAPLSDLNQVGLSEIPLLQGLFA